MASECLSTSDALTMWKQIFRGNPDLKDYYKHYDQTKEFYLHYCFIEDNFPALFADIKDDTTRESLLILANQALQSLDFKSFPKAQEGYVRFSDNAFLDEIALTLHREMEKEGREKKIEDRKSEAIDVFYLDERGRRCINYETLLNALLEKHTFKTLSDTEQVLVYEKGIYRDATVLIKGFIEDALGTDATSYIVREQIGHVQRRFYTDRELFNADRDFIPVKNGLLNLKSFKLEPFDPDRMYMFKLPGKFDESASYEATEQFFAEVVHKEDTAILQEFFGYCLIADLPAHKMMWLIGEGRNGKSTTGNLLKALIGELNTSAVQLNELDGEHRFSYVEMFGKLLNLVPEPPTKFGLQTPLIKAATGGDTIRGEIKGVQKPINFRNFAKFLIYANEIPRIFDTSVAFWNRTIAVHYWKQFVGEHEMKDIYREILKSDGLEGLLNWAIVGLKRLQANNYEFTTSKWQEETKKKMERSSQPVETFLEERCTIEDPNGEISKDDLYLAYQEYTTTFKLRVMGFDAFARNLRRAAPVTAERVGKGESRTRIWRGITLKNDENDEDDEDENDTSNIDGTQLTHHTLLPISYKTNRGNKGLNNEIKEDYHIYKMRGKMVGLPVSPGTSKNQTVQRAQCELCGETRPLTEIESGGISMMACKECVKGLREKNDNQENITLPTNNEKSKNNDMLKIGVDPRANDEDFQAEQSREAKIAMTRQLLRTPTQNINVSVMAIMHKIEVDTGPDMPILEILRKAEEAGITYDKTEEVIALMKRDGILYSPAEGVVTFAR